MQNAKDSISSVSNSDFFEVVLNQNTNQKSLRSLVVFKGGDFILNFSARAELDKPNYLSIQIDLNKHIELSPEFLQYTNHSCRPNVFFNTSTMELIAIEDINIGDEICFFYPSTELDMSQPFTCNCGRDWCVKEIKGALFMNKDILIKYRLNDLIKNQLSL